MINNLLNADYSAILSGAQVTQQRFKSLMAGIITLSNVIEGSGAPTQAAKKHSQYFDVDTNKY